MQLTNNNNHKMYLKAVEKEEEEEEVEGKKMNKMSLNCELYETNKRFN